MLRKDFMLDRYQVAEARAWGADCILIIMAAVDDVMAGTLCAYAKAWHMDAIAEVHDKDELDRALALDCRLIGINNRDLKTFDTTLETTERLAPRVPHDRIVIAESGIASHADLQRLAKAGVHAFLVGESLMRQADVAPPRARCWAGAHDALDLQRSPHAPLPLAGRGQGWGYHALETASPPTPSPSPQGGGEPRAQAGSPMTKLSHLNDKGEARMVDVSDKAATQRTARAEGFVAMAPATLALIETGEAKKGDVLAAARIAGIMAAKKTHELIPLCHPLAITKATVDFETSHDPAGHPRHRRGEGRRPDRRRDGSADGRLGRLPHHLRHAQGRRQSHDARRHPPDREDRRPLRHLSRGRSQRGDSTPWPCSRSKKPCSASSTA